MRTWLGEFQILWQCRGVFQLLTASDRYFEQLEPLFTHKIPLPDDFVLQHNHLLDFPRPSIDIDGISYELLDERGKGYLPKHWLDRFDSTDALIFVVPLQAYCQDHSAFTTPLVSEMYAFWCIVR